MRPVLSVLIVVGLVGAACSGTGEPDGLAMVESTSPTTTTTTTGASSTTTTVASVMTTVADYEMSTSTSTTEAAIGQTTTTSPPGRAADAPPGGGGAAGDLMSLYTGVLGTYAVNQPLAASPVAMPTVDPGISPLTGLPSARSSAGAIVVKIDNGSRARPQAGIDTADVVIEQEVEGGITRLAAIFQTSTPDRIGPVRSARSTDISFLSSLGRPGLAYSGANEVFDTLLLRQERVRNYSASRFGGYWRDNGRRAPSNLFTGMSQFSTDAPAPPAWFHFASGANDRGVPVSGFTAPFPATSVSWVWSGTAWQRSQNGSAHTAESGARIEAANVIVARVGVVESGLIDPSGSVVPEFVWAGEGPVSVFTNGRRIDGRWIRPSLGEPAVLVDGAGAIIELTPGITWVELTRSLP